MQPPRTARHHLQRLRRRAGRDQHGERIGFGVEGVDFVIELALCPMAADAGRFRQSAADAGRGGELILRPVAAENLPDFEQADIGKAAIGVAARRSDQARNEARPHVGKLHRDRIGERQFGLTAAEQFGLRLGDERPRHRFDQIARGERALGLAGAHLDRGEHRLSRLVAARKRRQRHLIDADDAHHFLDDIGLALDVRPP